MPTKQTTQKKKLVPLGDRVLLIKEDIAEESRKTKSGIIIPDAAVEKQSKEKTVAKVAEVSIELKSDTLKKGDRVIYSHYGTQDVKIDGQKYIVADYESIIAVYK